MKLQELASPTPSKQIANVDMVEVIGWVQDPNYNMSDFQGREMLFPKRWLTLGVLPASTEVKV